MQFPYHVLIGDAANIPIGEPSPVVSFSPVLLHVPDRPTDLQLRVSFPSTGDALPIILLSHGHGPSNYLSSLEGYAPLSEFWASHGFAVIQPTHLNSRSLGLDDPTGGMFWESRAHDMSAILDRLDVIEAAVPELRGRGRLDRTRVAVAGHSFGGLTTAMLLGASNTDPRDGSTVHAPEKRIKAGVILAGVGNGGADLSDAGRQRVPFYGPGFSTMNTPALVVCGDEDVSPHLTMRGLDWHADPFAHSPGPKDLLMVKGGKHGLGGVSGWDAAETMDESPERLAMVQRLTFAYLKSQLYEGDPAWGAACKALESLGRLGRIERKSGIEE